MITTQTIQDAFAADHDRLEDLFANFRHWKSEDFANAREFFKDFKFGLQRHIIWEEQILFPRFEQKTGLTASGPTVVMRAEHRQIADILEAIHEKVKKGDPNSDEEEEHLLRVLGSHNVKEESVLYPALDRLLRDAEKEAIFKAMEEVPEAAYRTCCGRPA